MRSYLCTYESRYAHARSCPGADSHHSERFGLHANNADGRTGRARGSRMPAGCVAAPALPPRGLRHRREDLQREEACWRGRVHVRHIREDDAHLGGKGGCATQLGVGYARLGPGGTLQVGPPGPGPGLVPQLCWNFPRGPNSELGPLMVPLKHRARSDGPPLARSFAWPLPSPFAPSLDGVPLNTEYARTGRPLRVRFRPQEKEPRPGLEPGTSTPARPHGCSSVLLCQLS